MPKYIKDGAYTIIVDERSISPKRTGSPKIDNDSGSEDSFGNSGARLDYERERDWGQGEDEEEEKEEEIDFTDSSFILKNLNIATPDFSEDKTYLLPCRVEISKIICSQVRFFCYCALDAYLRNPKSVSILIIGEGFIGARIINDLISNGCKDALRVCTRGDLTAEEWRARGIKADNDLPTLLDGEQPEIVIITVENASFTTICRQLTANFVLSASTFIISCSFGFQRRKLHAQLHTPNIFRSFVEPDQIFSRYKKNAFSSILAYTKTEIFNGMTDSISATGSVSTTNTLKSFAAPDLISLPAGVTKEEYDGAICMSRRSLDVRNIVFQLENFYAIQHHGFSEARRKALKNVFGVFIDEHGVETVGKPSSAGPAAPFGKGPNPVAPAAADDSYEALSVRKAMKSEAKLRSKLETMIRKLGEYNSCAHSYQTHFRTLISPEDLHTLKTQEYTADENEPKSGPNLGFQKYLHNAKGEGSKAPARNTIADLPGRPMYDADFITTIFRNDEDYTNFTGPGFDLMTSWDKKEEKKGTSNLKQLHALGGMVSTDSSVTSTHHHSKHPHPQHHVHGHARPTPTITAGTHLASTGTGNGTGIAGAALSEEEAAQELVDFGRRLSHYADHEASKIDQNYMQKYLRASSNNL